MLAVALRGFEGKISAIDSHEGSHQSQCNLAALNECTLCPAKMPLHCTPVIELPMRSGLWKDFVVRTAILSPLITGDAMPNRWSSSVGYAQGLVGQLPYQMGSMAMKTYDLEKADWSVRRSSGQMS
jgi:hypothetical protein